MQGSPGQQLTHALGVGPGQVGFVNLLASSGFAAAQVEEPKGPGQQGASSAWRSRLGRALW